MGVNHTYRYINTGDLEDPNSYPTTISLNAGKSFTANVSGPGYYTGALYDQYGSNKSSYSFRIACVRKHEVVCVGTYALTLYPNSWPKWSDACTASWTITIPAGVIFTNAITVNNCKIPKYSDLASLNGDNFRAWYSSSSGLSGDANYWLGTEYTSDQAYYVASNSNTGYTSISSKPKNNTSYVVPCVNIKCNVPNM